MVDNDDDDDDDKSQHEEENDLLPPSPPKRPNRITNVLDNDLESDYSNYDKAQSLIEFCFEDGWKQKDVNLLIKEGLSPLNLCEQDRVKLLLYAHTIKSDF